MDDEKPEIHRTIDVVTEHCGMNYLHDNHEELWFDGRGAISHLTYCPGTYATKS